MSEPVPPIEHILQTASPEDWPSWRRLVLAALEDQKDALSKLTAKVEALNVEVKVFKARVLAYAAGVAMVVSVFAKYADAFLPNLPS